MLEKSADSGRNLLELSSLCHRRFNVFEVDFIDMIEVKEIRKTYGKVAAADGVSFTIDNR